MKKFNYIYLITNNVNGKIYIGKHSTDNLDDEYIGSGVLLSKAKLKYGLENFTKEYLAFCDTEETLNYLEKFYIKKYKAREVGYNLTDGGEGSLGRIFSQETIEKMRLGHKGIKVSDKVKKLFSEKYKGAGNPNYGNKMTDESKLKMIEKLKLHKVSDEVKQKISNTLKNVPKPRYKWLTLNGEIKEMDKPNAIKNHPDWTLLN